MRGTLVHPSLDGDPGLLQLLAVCQPFIPQDIQLSNANPRWWRLLEGLLGRENG